MFDRLTALFEPHPRTAEAWLIRMGRPVVSRRDQAAFEAWLAVDPDHVADYQALKILMRETRALKSEFTAELAVIPRSRRRRRSLARPVFAVSAVGALAALVAAVVLSTWLSPFEPRDSMTGAQTFSTAIGEIRDITLEDGSRVTLDTATVLRARMDGTARRVALDRGAAYFDVRHGPSRPFQVALADRTVVVTGTRFATTFRNGEADVTLLEGAVVLTTTDATASDAPDTALRLAPGDRVVYRAGEAARRSIHGDPSQAAAWRDRRLVFQDVALSEALAELSRYTDIRIAAADPELGRRRVTAVFPLEGPEPLIDRIDRLFPVSVVSGGPGRVEVRAE